MISVAPKAIVAKELARRKTVVNCMMYGRLWEWRMV
jgi:hypothetical protein